MMRSYFDVACHSVPLFMALGNHDGESGWLGDATANNLAAWSLRAPKTFYPNPKPDGFYSGTAEEAPGIGFRRNYYAFEWGDALIVVLDPYTYTAPKPGADGWGWTLGATQYQWFAKTLATSRARFKFVFSHHLLGGNGTDARGGAAFARFFEWGDALFVVIDPYWHSPVPVDNGVPGVEKTKDAWEATIGDEQYAWFKRVLETSRAKYTFVFEHHVLGTGRGAVALVHTYEWGGYNRNGTAYEFSSLRRNRAKPIHRLMEDNKVTIFFFGHDHLFAREEVDGVVYQEVPNPADNTYAAFNADAYDPATVSLPGASYDPAYGVIMPNSGYLDVTVSPDRVTVAHFRAVLPGDEAKAGATNGAVTYSYSVTAR
jgi:hypothetical protein